jgi:hypothetical protein
MGWARHGACMGEKGCPFTILDKETSPEELGIDMWMILKWA